MFCMNFLFPRASYTSGRNLLDLIIQNLRQDGFLWKVDILINRKLTSAKQGVVVKLRTFSTSAPGEVKWSSSCSGRITPRKEPTVRLDMGMVNFKAVY